MTTDAVTGAYSFTGRHIAQRLLDAGREVVTLARRTPARDPMADRVTTRPLDFDQLDELRESLTGVDTLYNTYWIRFPRGSVTYERAVANTAALVGAARAAGVRRIVHFSVVNAAERPITPYFRAKAATERLVSASGLGYGILRPTLTYGDGDILINNMAWTLRRFPMFGLVGFGRCRVQPVHVDDVADIAFKLGNSTENKTIDAAGPEVYTLRELVGLVRERIGSHALVVPMPPSLALGASKVIGTFVRDVVLTSDEVKELTSSVLTSREPPRGITSLAEWLKQRGDSIGRKYASELDRHYRV